MHRNVLNRSISSRVACTGFFSSIENVIQSTQSIRKFKDPKAADCLYLQILSHGLEGFEMLGNYIVPMFAECERLQEAVRVFQKLSHRNEHSWTSIIAGFVDDNEPLQAFSMFKEMQEECVYPSEYTFMAVLKSCTELMDVAKGQIIHAEIVKEQYEDDIFVINGLLEMYGKCGFLAEAEAEFEELKCKDVVSWTTMIGIFADNGLGQEAINCLDHMHSQRLCPNEITAACSLKACGLLGDIDRGYILHNEIIALDLGKDFFVVNSLVDMYAKCGFLVEAEYVFHNQSVYDIISWTALIAAYADNGIYYEALISLDEMWHEGVTPDAVTYICCLKACSNANYLCEAQGIYRNIVLMGIENNLSVAVALVDVYTKCGSVEEAREVVDRAPIKNIIMYNVLIAGYVSNGLNEIALSIFEGLQMDDIYPDAFTFVSILQAYGNIGHIDMGQTVHLRMVKSGMNMEPFIRTVLVDMYVKCCRILEATYLLNDLEIKNMHFWTALSSGQLDLGFVQKTLACIDQAILKENFLDLIIISLGLKACSYLQDNVTGKKLHTYLVKHGFIVETQIGNLLLEFYMKCNLPCEAHSIFSDMNKHDTMSWNILITGFVEHGLDKEALECLDEMKRDSVSIDAVTIALTLKASLRFQDISIGRELHKLSIYYGFTGDPCVGCRLVEMYASHSCLMEASHVLEEFCDRDIAMWNVLIDAYFEHGHTVGAMTCMEKMLVDGLPPNLLSFVSRLRCYGKNGNICRSQELHNTFTKMGFNGDILIGNTLIDTYVKFGLLEETHDVLNKLSERDVVSWNVIVIWYVEQGYNVEALNCLGKMRLENISLNGLTYSGFLRACGNLGSFNHGRYLHCEIIVKGFDLDSFVCKALMDMYINCGSVVKAKYIFNKMKIRDIVSRTTLLAGYAYQGDSSHASRLLRKMENEKIIPNALTILNILRVCSHVGLIDEGLIFILGVGDAYNSVLAIEHYNCMVDILLRACQIGNGVWVLDSMPFHPDIVSRHITLGACQRSGYKELGEQAFINAVCLDDKDASTFVLMSNVHVISRVQ